MSVDLDDIERRMKGAVKQLQHDLSGLRTGRASISLLDPIVVEAYGAQMPLNQIATVAVPEPRMITVQVWDSGMTPAVDKAIRESSLGLNPATEGSLIRIPIPELNEDRRRELVKVAHRYGEQSRVAVRHVRKDGNDLAKKAEKDGEFSEDEMHATTGKIQKMADDHISQIDTLIVDKEKEIMHV